MKKLCLLCKLTKEKAVPHFHGKFEFPAQRAHTASDAKRRKSLRDSLRELGRRYAITAVAFVASPRLRRRRPEHFALPAVHSELSIVVQSRLVLSSPKLSYSCTAKTTCLYTRVTTCALFHIKRWKCCTP